MKGIVQRDQRQGDPQRLCQDAVHCHRPAAFRGGSCLGRRAQHRGTGRSSHRSTRTEGQVLREHFAFQPVEWRENQTGEMCTFLQQEPGNSHDFASGITVEAIDEQ